MEERAGVQISTRSWHYRLMKYVLGRHAPEPKTMRNLCPYFWLLIFTLMVSIVVIPLKLFFGLLNAIGNLLDKMLVIPVQDKRTEVWYEKQDEFSIYMLHRNNERIKKFINRSIRPS